MKKLRYSIVALTVLLSLVLAGCGNPAVDNLIKDLLGPDFSGQSGVLTSQVTVETNTIVQKVYDNAILSYDGKTLTADDEEYGWVSRDEDGKWFIKIPQNKIWKYTEGNDFVGITADTLVEGLVVENEDLEAKTGNVTFSDVEIPDASKWYIINGDDSNGEEITGGEIDLIVKGEENTLTREDFIEDWQWKFVDSDELVIDPAQIEEAEAKKNGLTSTVTVQVPVTNYTAWTLGEGQPALTSEQLTEADNNKTGEITSFITVMEDVTYYNDDWTLGEGQPALTSEQLIEAANNVDPQNPLASTVTVQVPVIGYTAWALESGDPLTQDQLTEADRNAAADGLTSTVTVQVPVTNRGAWTLGEGQPALTGDEQIEATGNAADIDAVESFITRLEDVPVYGDWTLESGDPLTQEQIAYADSNATSATASNVWVTPDAVYGPWKFIDQEDPISGDLQTQASANAAPDALTSTVTYTDTAATWRYAPGGADLTIEEIALIKENAYLEGSQTFEGVPSVSTLNFTGSTGHNVFVDTASGSVTLQSGSLSIPATWARGANNAIVFTLPDNVLPTAEPTYTVTYKFPFLGEMESGDGVLTVAGNTLTMPPDVGQATHGGNGIPENINLNIPNVTITTTVYPSFNVDTGYFTFARGDTAVKNATLKSGDYSFNVTYQAKGTTNTLRNTVVITLPAGVTLGSGSLYAASLRTGTPGTPNQPVPANIEIELASNLFSGSGNPSANIALDLKVSKISTRIPVEQYFKSYVDVPVERTLVIGQDILTPVTREESFVPTNVVYNVTRTVEHTFNSTSFPVTRERDDTTRAEPAAVTRTSYTQPEPKDKPVTRIATPGTEDRDFDVEWVLNGMLNAVYNIREVPQFHLEDITLPVYFVWDTETTDPAAYVIMGHGEGGFSAIGSGDYTEEPVAYSVIAKGWKEKLEGAEIAEFKVAFVPDGLVAVDGVYTEKPTKGTLTITLNTNKVLDTFDPTLRWYNSAVEVADVDALADEVWTEWEDGDKAIIADYTIGDPLYFLFGYDFTDDVE